MQIGQNPRLIHPERIFQSGAGRAKASGQTVSRQMPETPSERVVLSGRSKTFSPLKSLSGHTLSSHASRLGQEAANAAGLPASVASYFTPTEFYMLNSGDYHDSQHPQNVAGTVAEMATNSGRSSERARFLSQVALLHDADERIVLDGNGNYSTLQGAKPARVPVTLAFMDINEEGLSERFGWTRDDFSEAKALIAATEHPLNENAPGSHRNYGLPAYDGKNSATVFEESLENVAPSRRAALLEDAQIMRFADQSANYLQGVEAARRTVSGLANEIGAPAEALQKGTPDFLEGLGKDSEKFQDRPQAVFQELRHSFQLENSSQLYKSGALHRFLSDDQRAALASVKKSL